MAVSFASLLSKSSHTIPGKDSVINPYPTREAG